MSFGVIKVLPVSTIASGASTSSGVPLGGKAWQRIAVQVGTMSTGAAIKVQNSIDGGATYYDVFMGVNSSATQANALVIASGSAVNGGCVALPIAGLNHLRFITSAVVSGGVSFNVICSD